MTSMTTHQGTYQARNGDERHTQTIVVGEVPEGVTEIRERQQHRPEQQAENARPARRALSR